MTAPIGWISVYEQMPLCDVCVLAWDITEQSWRIAYWDGTWYMVGFDDDTAIQVSHWMPLPEPPAPRSRPPETR